MAACQPGSTTNDAGAISFRHKKAMRDHETAYAYENGSTTTFFCPARMPADEHMHELHDLFDRADKDKSGLTSQQLAQVIGMFYDPRTTAAVEVLSRVAEHDRVTFPMVVVASKGRAYVRAVPFPARVFMTLEDPGCCAVAKVTSTFVMLLIILSSFSFVMETMPAFQSQDWCKKPEDKVNGVCTSDAEPGANPAFGVLETVCIVAFTIEYTLRLITAWAAPLADDALHNAEPVIVRDMLGKPLAALDHEHLVRHAPLTTCGKTLAFMMQFSNLIDLVAILPFYIALVVSDGPGGLSVLRVLRLARIFRIFKLGKYNEGMQMYGRVIGNSSSAFSLLVFFFSILMVLFGSVIYSAEMGEWFGPGEDCPSDEGPGSSNSTCLDKYGHGTYLRPVLSGNGGLEATPFLSITHGFWWVIVTTATVGYGDLYPTTTAGKFVGFVAIPMGIVVIALPILIVANNFTAEYYSVQELNEARQAEKEMEQLRHDALNLTGVAAAKAKIDLETLQQKAMRNESFKLRLKTRRASAIGFTVYKREEEDLDTYDYVSTRWARDKVVAALERIPEPETDYLVAQIDKMASAVDAEQTIEPTEVDELLFCVLSFVTRSKNMSACCELRRSLLAFCSVCLAGGAEEGADAADAADEVAGNPQGSQPRKRSVNHVAKRRLSRIFQDDLLHLATMESICVGEDSSEDDTITE